MRPTFPDKLEYGRLLSGYFASKHGERFGAFRVFAPTGIELVIMASDGRDVLAAGWEHVSVSIKHRPPNWSEMSFVKGLFWEEEETVIQLHPPRSVYVDVMPNCLHLWKPPYPVPLPNTLLVGDKGPPPKSPAEAIARQQKIIKEHWR